jgi:hypothetical protein
MEMLGSVRYPANGRVKMVLFYLLITFIVMATFGLEFNVTCETSFGERACICGNLPVLGQWNPAQGVILETDQKRYPVWSTVTPISIRYLDVKLGKGFRFSSSFASSMT